MSGGDGLRSGREQRGEGERAARRGEVEGDTGLRGNARGVQCSGGARRQAGGGRRASGTRPRPPGAVEKMTGSWAAQ